MAATVLIPLNIVVMFCLSLNMGCAARQDFRFRVVDAATGMPLSEVVGTRYGRNLNMLSAKSGERELLPVTSAAGMTTARQADMELTQSIGFSKGGYANATVSFNRRTLPTVYVVPHLPDKVLGPRQAVLPERAADGSAYYRIPLEPQGPKGGAADK